MSELSQRWCVQYPTNEETQILRQPGKKKDESKMAAKALATSPHFFCLVTMLRGGVTGRLELGFFFSAGFRICEE
ncbi:hypothetical protein P4O66_016141, partial [Electrophorus voltai]